MYWWQVDVLVEIKAGVCSLFSIAIDHQTRPDFPRAHYELFLVEAKTDT